MVKAATPAQLAANAHIAANLRGWMKANSVSPSQLGGLIGREKGYSGVYQWLRGISAPGPDMRQLIMDATGLTAEQLTPRSNGGAPGTSPWASRVAAASKPAAAKPTKPPSDEVLSFTVSSNGEANLRLNITQPFQATTELLRTLLGTGVLDKGNWNKPEEVKLIGADQQAADDEVVVSEPRTVAAPIAPRVVPRPTRRPAPQERDDDPNSDEAILALLRQRKEPMTTARILLVLGANEIELRKRVRGRLGRLRERGFIRPTNERDKRLRWVISEPSSDA